MVKQIIVMRKDLNMRKGKIAAQAGHAVLSVIFKKLNMLDEFFWSVEQDKVVFEGDEALDDWFANGYTKICLYVNSEQELLDLKKKADSLGFVTSLIKENGATEFNGVPTYTCIAFEPLPAEKIDILTKDLPLY